MEICRQKAAMDVPLDLKEDYFGAIAKLSEISGKTHSRNFDSSQLVYVLAAFAISKGNAALSEAILELTPDVLHDFRDWIESR